MPNGGVGRPHRRLRQDALAPRGSYRKLARALAGLFTAAMTCMPAGAETPLSAAVETESGYTYLIAESNSAVLQSLHESGDDARKGSYNFLTYALGILVDPCQGHSADCCMDIFGEPEYLRQAPVIPKGWLWALAAESHGIYQCRMPCIGNWTMIEDSTTIHDYNLDIVDADVDFIWGLSLSEDKLFVRRLDGYSSWEFVSGSFSSVSASGAYAVYAINRNDPLEILACLKPCDGQWKVPTEVTGHPNEGSDWGGPDLGGSVSAYSAVSADNTHLYLTMDDGRLFARRVLLPSNDTSIRWKDVWVENGLYGQWIDLTPPGVQIAKVSTCVQLEVIWALSASGAALSCPHPCAADDWIEVSAPGSNGIIQDLDVDDRYVWVTTVDGNVYRRSASQASAGSSWTSIPSAASSGDATVEARKTVPSGGFKRITAPAFPNRTEAITEYMVEEFGQDCALTSTEEACALKTTERCEWNVDAGICEKKINSANSRFPDLDVIFEDPTCVIAEVVAADGTVSMQPGFAVSKDHEEEALGLTRDPGCVEHGVRKATSSDMPACWDNNATVRADTSCTNSDGNVSSHCVAIGYSATVFIPKCGGAYADSSACGSFIELHAPGEPDIINEIKLPSDTNFTSGYRTLTMPLSFANNTDRLVCVGGYELWWTQRTRKRRIVEATKKFQVVYPPCDWNTDAGAYETYASTSA